MGPNGFYMAIIGYKWSLVPKNGLKQVERGWNRVWGIGTDYSDHFTNP